MLDLFTLPTGASTTAGVSDYSSTWFIALLAIGFLGVGVIIGGMATSFLMRKIIAAVSKVLGGRKGGRRRR